MVAGTKTRVKLPATVTLPAVIARQDSPPKPATTTAEQDLHTAGQRRVNMTWEYTQALIAGSVVLTTCIGIGLSRVLPAEWWLVVGIVTGFYFGRTNHARIGDLPNSKALDTR